MEVLLVLGILPEILEALESPLLALLLWLSLSLASPLLYPLSSLEPLPVQGLPDLLPE